LNFLTKSGLGTLASLFKFQPAPTLDTITGAVKQTTTMNNSYPHPMMVHQVEDSALANHENSDSPMIVISAIVTIQQKHNIVLKFDASRYLRYAKLSSVPIDQHPVTTAAAMVSNKQHKPNNDFTLHSPVYV